MYKVFGEWSESGPHKWKNALQNRTVLLNDRYNFVWYKNGAFYISGSLYWSSFFYLLRWTSSLFESDITLWHVNMLEWKDIKIICICILFPFLFAPFFFSLLSFLLILNWFAFDIDAYFERLNEELNMVEAESTKISNEIEILARTNVEGKDQYWLFMYKPVCIHSQVFLLSLFPLFYCRFYPIEDMSWKVGLWFRFYYITGQLSIKDKLLEILI